MNTCHVMEEEEEECKERREAELEFIASAYDRSEAWYERTTTTNDQHVATIFRRLSLPRHDFSTSPSPTSTISIQLILQLPPTYPLLETLRVSARIAAEVPTNSTTTTAPTSATPATSSNRSTTTAGSTSSINQHQHRKTVLNSLPLLESSCRDVAEQNRGEESVFSVLHQAEEWVHDTWPTLLHVENDTSNKNSSYFSGKKCSGGNGSPKSSPNKNVLGRRLIYSHHIISKIKRAEMKELCSTKQFHLTGYVKIGWPGIILIEGWESDCIAFYDIIRKWQWKYLVVRGEQQEVLPPITAATTDTPLPKEYRKFNFLVETDDMSVVADHCRRVGLESLFLTSMKVYNNDGTTNEKSTPPVVNCCSGALIHVDHMNDAKAYRKWLRKTSSECDLLLLSIQQYYAKADYSGRPTIVVAIVASEASVLSQFLKRWRTSKVDVDAKGRPCLERQMTILSEGELPQLAPSDVMELQGEDWNGETSVTTTKELMLESMTKLGGASWHQALLSLPSRH